MAFRVASVTFDWTVMRDPEGNEICVVRAPADDPVETWRTCMENVTI